MPATSSRALVHRTDSSPAAPGTEIVTFRITTGFSGRSPSGYSVSLRTGKEKMRLATSKPLVTLPKIVKFPSRKGALLKVI